MRSKKKRHSITLLEIMIVVLLIGIIGGVLSYNLKGTLERGKVFRTEEGIKRLKEILDLEIERKTTTLDKLLGPNGHKEVDKCVKASGLIAPNKIADFLLDGWKEPYIYTRDKDKNKDELIITSARLDAYLQEHPPSKK